MTEAVREGRAKDAGGDHVVPLDPGSGVVVYVGDTPPAGEHVRGVIVADSPDPQVVADTVRSMSSTAARVCAVGSRLKVDVEDVLEALELVTRVVPPGPMDQSSQLSEHDQATLRAAGLLRTPTRTGATTASARAAAAYAQLLGNSVTVKEAAARLRVSEQRIRQRLNERSLYGFQSQQGWRIPEFQFSVAPELPGLKQVLQALPEDLHPLSVEGFFLRPKPELVLDDEAVSVTDWLGAGGDPAPVVAIARDLLVA